LPFTDNSALTTSSNVGLGRDYSGNGNYWTTNNISITAGVTYDSMTDVPTLTSATAANYATLNPLGGVTTGGPTLTDGNLNYGQGAAAWNSCGSTIQPNSGKWYFEVSGFVSGSNYSAAGFRAVGNIGSGEYAGSSAGSYGGVQTSINLVAYSGGSAGGSISGTFSINTPIQVAVDFDAGKVWFGSLNGTWIGGGNPASGTSPTYTFTAGTQLNPYVSAYANNTYANFGQRPFTYTPPTGFVALNTFNLPTPTIGSSASTLANKNFDATIYTGNGTSQSVVNSGGFQPDFVWVKNRTSALNHILANTVAGITNFLSSNNTSVEGSTAGVITSVNSNGFSVGSITNVNQNTNALVGWQWRGGGTAVTNTAGSISAQVSANASAGFSVVTFTTQASGTSTVGHGLGVAPAMIITKARSAVNGWNTYHISSGANNYLQLNTTAAQVADTTYWNNTAPTSSVFSLGTAWAGSFTVVAYCFSEVAGYSKFGSYTGNGSADGPFVFTGFRPRFVLYKRTDSTENWVILDTTRSSTNVMSSQLYPNLSNAEGTGTANMDMLSNGFKLRSGVVGGNTSGATFIYMAFAENPFKYSLAR
jgi:hypothetical protein